MTTLLQAALDRYRAEHPQRRRDPDIPDFLMALIAELDGCKALFEARLARLDGLIASLEGRQ